MLITPAVIAILVAIYKKNKKIAGIVGAFLTFMITAIVLFIWPLFGKEKEVFFTTP